MGEQKKLTEEEESLVQLCAAKRYFLTAHVQVELVNMLDVSEHTL